MLLPQSKEMHTLYNSLHVAATTDEKAHILQSMLKFYLHVDATTDGNAHIMHSF